MSDDLTFAQLRAFIHAARADSFAQAAERLEISQPSISELIKLLEERLRRRLFQRRKGARSRLTQDGAEVLEQAEKILGLYSDLFRREPKPQAKTTVRISIGPYLRAAYLKPLVPRLAREYPDVEIDVQPMPEASVDAMRGIERGTLDLAFCEAPALGSLQQGEEVHEFPLVLVGAPGTQARLSAGEVHMNDFQFIFPLHRSFGARWAQKRLREAGLTPRVAPLFVEFADILAQMVEAGQGIGCLNYHSVADRIDEGRLEALNTLIQPMRRVVARSPVAPEVTNVIEGWIIETLTESNGRWAQCRAAMAADRPAS